MKGLCAAEMGGHQAPLQLVRALMVQTKEFEHHLEGVKGPVKAV